MNIPLSIPMPCQQQRQEQRLQQQRTNFFFSNKYPSEDFRTLSLFVFLFVLLFLILQFVLHVSQHRSILIGLPKNNGRGQWTSTIVSFFSCLLYWSCLLKKGNQEMLRYSRSSFENRSALWPFEEISSTWSWRNFPMCEMPFFSKKKGLIKSVQDSRRDGCKYHLSSLRSSKKRSLRFSPSEGNSLFTRLSFTHWHNQQATFFSELSLSNSLSVANHCFSSLSRDDMNFDLCSKIFSRLTRCSNISALENHSMSTQRRVLFPFFSNQHFFRIRILKCSYALQWSATKSIFICAPLICKKKTIFMRGRQRWRDSLLVKKKNRRSSAQLMRPTNLITLY